MQPFKRVCKIMLACFILSVTACNAKSIDVSDMDSAEKKFNRKQSQELLAYMSVNDMFPDKQVRALAEAAGKGKIKEIDALVAQGVDVNSRGTRNATPLFWALKNKKGFKRLLELGADPNVAYGDGGTVIHWAVKHEDDYFLRLVLKFGGNVNLVAGEMKETPIFEAVSPESKGKVGLLLSADANINYQRANGDTVSMVAARLGQFDVVYSLLDHGADPSLKNGTGKSLVDVIEFRKRTVDPQSELTRWMEKVIDKLISLEKNRKLGTEKNREK